MSHPMDRVANGRLRKPRNLKRLKKLLREPEQQEDGIRRWAKPTSYPLSHRRGRRGCGLSLPTPLRYGIVYSGVFSAIVQFTMPYVVLNSQDRKSTRLNSSHRC